MVFLRLISHEINTPLNGVIGFADFLKEQLVSTEYFTMIEKLSESAHRLNDFAQSSLIITRMRTMPEEYKKVEIELRGLVDNVLTSNLEWIEKKKIGITLHWDVPTSLIDGNHELMSICLNHLFRNALQYTPDKGTIAIACRKEKRWLTLTLEDNGTGFSEKSFENMFKPFSTADELIDNNKGLGLSIVKMIADFHEAGIHISNRLEGGARVELCFPSRDTAVQ